jgi:drug/metabolite transporter (DMT)-like permease
VLNLAVDRANRDLLATPRRMNLTLVARGPKFIPSADAGPLAPVDVVLGPIWVFIAFGENPGLATTLGGAIVLAAAAWRLAPELRRERVP